MWIIHKFYQHSYISHIQLCLYIWFLSRLKSWSESIQCIGFLCKVLCDWFLLHTLFGICFVSVTAIISRNGFTIMFVGKFIFFVVLIISSTTLCCFAFCSCIVLWQLFQRRYQSIRHTMCLIVVFSILTRLISHIVSHFSSIYCIYGTILSSFHQCIHVVTDAIYYNLMYFSILSINISFYDKWITFQFLKILPLASIWNP